MIVYQPDLIRQDDKLILAARLETQTPVPGWPEYLWYRFPQEYEPYISLQTDAFVLPCLPAAVERGEDVDVRGPISPQLAYHLQGYADLFALILGKPKIVVSFDHVQPEAAKPDGVAVSFSGGVDSFFTLYNHLPSRQPDLHYQVSHALMVLGFDLPLDQVDNFYLASAKYQAMLNELGVELLTIETNTRAIGFTQTAFGISFIPFLAAAGLTLSKKLRRFILPSPGDFLLLSKHRSFNLLKWEHFTSNDNMEVHYDMPNMRRIDKIDTLADWGPFQQHLRVCYFPELGSGTPNCSRCEKCIRTMLPLYASGKLEKVETFKQPFTHNYQILRWIGQYSPRHIYSQENSAYMKQHRPVAMKYIFGVRIWGTIIHFLKSLWPKRWQARFDPVFVKHLNIQPHRFDLPEVQAAIQANKL